MGAWDPEVLGLGDPAPSDQDRSGDGSRSILRASTAGFLAGTGHLRAQGLVVSLAARSQLSGHPSQAPGVRPSPWAAHATPKSHSFAPDSTDWYQDLGRYLSSGSSNEANKSHQATALREWFTAFAAQTEGGEGRSSLRVQRGSAMFQKVQKN